MTELLTSIEKHEGIICLATNRPYDLDEAMYRRITSVFEYSQPNHIQRKEIWSLFTSHKALPMSPGIDWDHVSLKYVFVAARPLFSLFLSLSVSCSISLSLSLPLCLLP